MATRKCYHCGREVKVSDDLKPIFFVFCSRECRNKEISGFQDAKTTR